MYDSPACEAVNADCLKCPKAVDNLILYASHSRGFHFIMPKCDNNIIMFLLKGEALVNSEEYAGVTLHAGEFILQAVGSKYEVLAMTDVECVCYRFSQPESFCEGRFQHIVKDVVPPLIFFPLKICSELNFSWKLRSLIWLRGRFVGSYCNLSRKNLRLYCGVTIRIMSFPCWCIRYRNTRIVFSISYLRIMIRSRRLKNLPN